MASYAVGDIQGCLQPLTQLLELARFCPKSDTLWVAGDLVNRGPQSLETLRFIKNLPSTKVVLGNHDLHLLAAAKGHKTLGKKDTLTQILMAPDKQELLGWLQQQSLIHHDKALGYTMVHAGIPPTWSISKTIALANEVETVLRSPDSDNYFRHMYGNTPSQWDDGLKSVERLRVITNYLTRMRFCNAKGTLELETKTDVAPPGFDAWFRFESHLCKGEQIIFGHWASLLGNTGEDNFIALDTGCVWGGRLTMMRLEDKQIFSLACSTTA